MKTKTPACHEISTLPTCPASGGREVRSPAMIGPSRRRGRRDGLPFVERFCELELRSERWRRYGISPKSAMRLGQITARGIYMRRQLVRRGFPEESIIEVYPGASWKITDGKAIGRILSSARNEDRKAQRVLAWSLQRQVKANSEDLTRYGLDGLDSVMCALTAYWHTHDETERVGDEDGWIVVPRPRR